MATEVITEEVPQETLEVVVVETITEVRGKELLVPALTWKSWIKKTKIPVFHYSKISKFLDNPGVSLEQDQFLPQTSSNMILGVLRFYHAIAILCYSHVSDTSTGSSKSRCPKSKCFRCQWKCPRPQMLGMPPKKNSLEFWDGKKSQNWKRYPVVNSHIAIENCHL